MSTLKPLEEPSIVIDPMFLGVDDIVINVERDGRTVTFGYDTQPKGNNQSGETGSFQMLAGEVKVKPYKTTGKNGSYMDSFDSLGFAGTQTLIPKQPLKFLLSNPEKLTRKNVFRIRTKNGKELALVIYRDKTGIVAEKHHLHSSLTRPRDVVFWIPE